MARKKTELTVPVPAKPVSLDLPKDAKAALKICEACFGEHRKGIFALREIRERKLYQAANYQTFDDYMEERWGRTRQWATQEINWLRAMELLEERTGKSIYQFPSDTVRSFARLIADPQQLYEAFLEFNLENTYEKTVATSVVGRRKEFMKLRNHESGKYKTLTYEEWRAAHQLSPQRSMSLDGDLIEECKKLRSFPLAKDMFDKWRGEQLLEQIKPLYNLQAEWEHESELLAGKKKLFGTLEKVKMIKDAKLQEWIRKERPKRCENCESNLVYGCKQVQTALDISPLDYDVDGTPQPKPLTQYERAKKKDKTAKVIILENEKVRCGAYCEKCDLWAEEYSAVTMEEGVLTELGAK